MRTLFTVLLVLVVSMPAWGKTRHVYPDSCDDLWAAVKDTLGTQRNYGIVSMDDFGQRASFTIIGSLVMYTDKVSLTATGGGCAMETTILQVGPDDTDGRQFHKRVERSLANLQAAKSKPAATPPTQ